MRYKYIDASTRVKKCYLSNKYNLQRKYINFLGFTVWQNKEYTYGSVHVDFDDMLKYLLWEEKNTEDIKKLSKPHF